MTINDATSVLVGPQMTPDRGVLAKAMLLGEKVHIVAPSLEEVLGEGAEEYEPFFEVHHLDELDEGDRRKIIDECMAFGSQAYESSAAARGWISVVKAGAMTEDLLSAFDGRRASIPFGDGDLDVIQMGKAQVDLLMYMASQALAERYGLTALVDSRFVRSLMPSATKTAHRDDADEVTAIVYETSTAKFHKGYPTLAQVARVRDENIEAFQAFFKADAAQKKADSVDACEQRDKALKTLISETRLLRRARRRVIDATAPVITAWRRREMTVLPLAVGAMVVDAAGDIQTLDSMRQGEVPGLELAAAGLAIGWMGHRSYVGAKVRSVLESLPASRPSAPAV